MGSETGNKPVLSYIEYVSVPSFKTCCVIIEADQCPAWPCVKIIHAAKNNARNLLIHYLKSRSVAAENQQWQHSFLPLPVP